MGLYFSLPATKSGKIKVKFTRSQLANDKGFVLYCAGWLEEKYIPVLAPLVKNKTANQLLNEGMAIYDKPYDAAGGVYLNVWRNQMLKDAGVPDAEIPDGEIPTPDQNKIVADILASAKYYSMWENGWNYVWLAGAALVTAIGIWAVKHSGKKKNG